MLGVQRPDTAGFCWVLTLRECCSPEACCLMSDRPPCATENIRRHILQLALYSFSLTLSSQVFNSSHSRLYFCIRFRFQWWSIGCRHLEMPHAALASVTRGNHDSTGTCRRPYGEFACLTISSVLFILSLLNSVLMCGKEVSARKRCTEMC